MRSVEMTGQIATATGDQSYFDVYDFDTAIPEMSISQHTPAHWLADEKKKAAKAAARAQQAEREAQAKEMPAKAAIIKAQAIASKAATGGNTGGVLSGTPESGMPQVPGNPPGTPGTPGLFGMPGASGAPAL